MAPRVCFWIIGLLATTASWAQPSLVNHWETVVYDTSQWKYLPGTSNPGTDWMLASYSDNAWSLGNGGFGYGDNDDSTILSTPIASVFLRKKFSIIDKNIVASLLFHMDFDDGFVAYLNGVEIGRANLGSGTPSFDQLTTADHEALLFQGATPDKFEIDPQILLTGENILSVEVHNVALTSSDMTARPFLSVGILTSAITYGPTPSWFVPPTPLNFPSSNLPIVVINTHGQIIVDEPRITADMGIVYNGDGNMNAITDPFNNYNGKIGIEIRGESSQGFPKKSWRLETHDAAGNNLDVSLLGMPSDNDWVLYAPYTDKTMMRDVLTYVLSRQLGKVYAPRSKFVEVVLNNEYQGVYVLMEKIKRNKNRVAISKLNPEDVSEDAVTGGYILRVDKLDANDYPAWTPIPVPQLANESNPPFQFYDPKGEDLVSAQQTYIKNYIQQFESALSASTFDNEVTGYRKFIDAPSFIDFMLISEIGKNIDSYIFSTYMYKERDSKGGKLFMGPLWDFNLAFGNVNYLANSQYAPGWTYDDSYRMFWFRRLMKSPAFADSMKCRWVNLRQTTLSNDHILGSIDSMATLLGESQVRNYERWPILGTYVWPNQYIGATFADEVTFLKTWIATRLTWMDDYMPGSCDSTTITAIEPTKSLSQRADLYPNPTRSSVQIKFRTNLNAPTLMTVYNSMGELVATKEFGTSQDPTWDGGTSDESPSPSGLYIVEVRSSDKVVFKGKVVLIK